MSFPWRFSILSFVPPIGLKINGSRRWIQVGFGTFQPSELAKVAVVFFTAWWFEKFEKDAGRFFKGLVFPFAIVSLILLPISRQEDLGYTALIGAAVLCVMFVAGMRLRWILPIVLVGVVAILYLAIHIEERRDRLLAFLNPEDSTRPAVVTSSYRVSSRLAPEALTDSASARGGRRCFTFPTRIRISFFR